MNFRGAQPTFVSFWFHLGFILASSLQPESSKNAQVWGHCYLLETWRDGSGGNLKERLLLSNFRVDVWSRCVIIQKTVQRM